MSARSNTMPNENRYRAARARGVNAPPATVAPNVARHGRLTSEQIWEAIQNASFAVLGYVTPSGEPRSSGVLYKVVRRRLYVAVDRDGWKARHIGRSGKVAVTVPIRRGGPLSLAFPIPPATVSFHGSSVVHPPGAGAIAVLSKELASLLPPDGQATAAVVEIVPEGVFVTYGLGVTLNEMRDPEVARARVPVAP